MKEQVKKTSGGVPLAIIALVLGVVIIGGFWFYRSSNPANRTPTPANSATTTPNAKPAVNWANLPSGAQPPNSIGSPTATVTVEEFADYQCGSCAAAHPILKEVTSTYGGNKNFRFIFRNNPLSMHDKAYDAAVAAEAAGLQGKFWQMQDRIFSNQGTWSSNPAYRDTFAKYAEEVGIDVEKFKADMSGMSAKQRVDNDLVRGRAAGVSSTPSVFINGRLIPYAEVTSTGLRRIIDAELSTAGAPAANSPAPAGGAAPAANANK